MMNLKVCWNIVFVASCLVVYSNGALFSSLDRSIVPLQIVDATEVGNNNVGQSSIHLNNDEDHDTKRILQSAVTLPFRINAGNTTTSYTDPSTNKVWLRDQYFTGTEVWNGCPEAVRTGFNLASHLCQTRQRSSFEYQIPVPYDGEYKVTLYFVETIKTRSRSRIFTVRAEGLTMLSNIDVFNLVGGRMRPYIRTFTVFVSDGFLTLRFSGKTDKAMISAIEVEDGRVTLAPIRSPTKQPIATPTSIPLSSSTSEPSYMPTSVPTSTPTSDPSYMPTPVPVSLPTSVPVSTPTSVTTSTPTSIPVSAPTSIPTNNPTLNPVLQPTFAPVTNPTLPSPTTSLLSTVRINCGSLVSYVDPSGNTWSADVNFQSGGRFSNCPSEIIGTTLDTIYCSERFWGGPAGMNGTYTIPVVPGEYTVRLMFAELFFRNPGNRIFNVYLQNRIIRRDFDIRLVTGGRNISLDVLAKVTATSSDPNIRLKFQNVVQNGKIHGIEIFPYDGSVTDAPTNQPVYAPTRAPTSPFETILINCGSVFAYEDSLARYFAPDQFFSGGSMVSGVIPIANTVDDTIYQTERVGDAFSYEIPVPVGSFVITLLLSENQYNATGERLFDVIVENERLTNIDIIQTAGGAMTATKIQFFKIVEDDFLTIEFVRSAEFPNAGLPKVNAIEVALDKPHIAHAVATGPYIGTVVNQNTNTANVQLFGQTSHTHGEMLSLTNFTWKEGNTVLGTTINTNYSFGVGTHTVSLTIADNGGNTDTESTTVNINPFGFPAITSLIPSSGSLVGQYPLTITGSGFNYTSSEIKVMFGTTELTGSEITILNQSAISIVTPSNLVAQPVDVTIQTPLGTSAASTFSFVGSIPLLWQEFKLLDFFQPTVGRFGPDSKLYVGTRYGRLLKVTLNDDFTSVVNSIVSHVNRDYQEAILGLTFDPTDVKLDPDVYFTMNRFFARGNQSTSGTTVAGRIRRASGVNLETVVDIITGLPCSDIDHGLNGLEFADDGSLYFASGSHTNGGIPGPLSSSRILKENFLSAAINIAYLSHPDFNGTIRWSAPDDGNIIAKGIDVFAPGTRNPYGLYLHSNGKLYATDNGPNEAYGPMSIGCNGESIYDQKRDDEILLIERGQYYGSPNLKRASVLNDPRQCVWHGPESTDYANHATPLITHRSSIDGIMEFHGNHFGGQLRYNLIYSRYGGLNNIFRVILTPDGRAVIPSLMKKGLAMNIGNVGLDITQAPNGNLVDIRYGNSSVYLYAPIEPATTALIAKTCFPRRGRSSGGTTLSIYGVNMNTRSTIVTVTIGGVNCPTTFVSPTKVDCTLPGGSGTVDIVVKNGAATSTFERGYRYISGTLPIGFVIPHYTG